jgi:hypothetical protein
MMNNITARCALFLLSFSCIFLLTNYECVQADDINKHEGIRRNCGVFKAGSCGVGAERERVAREVYIYILHV